MNGKILSGAALIEVVRWTLNVSGRTAAKTSTAAIKTTTAMATISHIDSSFGLPDDQAENRFLSRPRAGPRAQTRSQARPQDGRPNGIPTPGGGTFFEAHGVARVSPSGLLSRI